MKPVLLLFDESPKKSTRYVRAFSAKSSKFQQIIDCRSVTLFSEIHRIEEAPASFIMLLHLREVDFQEILKISGKS